MRVLPRAVRAWNRFWFQPESTATLALFRIAIGLVLTAWTISLLPDLRSFFGPNGITGRPRLSGWTWSLLELWHGRSAVFMLWALLLAAAICLVLGIATRVASVVALVAVVTFERQNLWLYNSGDLLLRNLLLFLAFAPAGAALSFDRWWRPTRDFWAFPARAVWPLRLLQIQLSVVYIATVWAKLRGEMWNDGTAVSYALRIGDLVRFRAPSFLTDSLILTNLLTFGTLAVEASIGILVWKRVARPWVLGLGVLLHVVIDVTLDVGFFSWTLLALYLVFVPPEVAERLVGRIRRLPSSSDASVS